MFSRNYNRKKIYIILSVDTEHDILSKFTTRTAGWSIGIPILFKVFDSFKLMGKVCWLIEYNNKDGFLASNTDSDFFVKDSKKLINQIKERGDEIGIHPTMKDWIGGDKNISASSYNDPKFWDSTRSNNDPEFVMKLITNGTKKFIDIFGITPIGCRTGAFQYASCLTAALEKNGIFIDSSVSKGLLRKITAPNAYFAAKDNILNEATTNPKVLEIPTTGYIDSKPSVYNFMLKLRSWYLLHSRNTIFLSFFIHNWQAITNNSKENTTFLKNLSLFLNMLKKYNACFLSWNEANKIYREIYRNKSRMPYDMGGV